MREHSNWFTLSFSYSFLYRSGSVHSPAAFVGQFIQHLCEKSEQTYQVNNAESSMTHYATCAFGRFQYIGVSSIIGNSARLSTEGTCLLDMMVPKSLVMRRGSISVVLILCKCHRQSSEPGVSLIATWFFLHCSFVPSGIPEARRKNFLSHLI